MLQDYHQSGSNQTFKFRKIRCIFRDVELLLIEMLENISQIYKRNGIKYFVKPHQEFFMRLLIPSQLKVFIDMGNIYNLFQDQTNLPIITIQKNETNYSYTNNKIVNFPQNNNLVNNSYLNQNNKEKTHHMGVFPQNSLFSSRPQQYDNIHINNIKGLDGMTERQRRQFKRTKKNLKENQFKTELYNWLGTQANEGRAVTRNDLTIKIKEIAQKYEVKCGQRWLRRQLANNSRLRQLLTHGNSTSIRKNSIPTLSHQNISSKWNKINEQVIKKQNGDSQESGLEYSINQLQVSIKSEEYKQDPQLNIKQNFGRKIMQKLDNSRKYNFPRMKYKREQYIDQ